tara:strand:- start:13993 stop:14424 length:432 start_codon:yes stop_codon:yes gene_type:complete
MTKANGEENTICGNCHPANDNMGKWFEDMGEWVDHNGNGNCAKCGSYFCDKEYKSVHSCICCNEREWQCNNCCCKTLDDDSEIQLCKQPCYKMIELEAAALRSMDEFTLITRFTHTILPKDIRNMISKIVWNDRFKSQMGETF